MPLISSIIGRFWLPALLFLLLLVQTVRIEGFGIWPFKIPGLQDKYDTAVQKLVKARAERDSLIAAQKEAKRLNEQQVQRIEKEQQEISDDIEARYKADRERLQRELAERLRKPAAPRNPGSPQAAPDGKAPGGPDETAKVCIPTGDYVHGAEVELQLDALIGWVEQQLKVVR